MKTRIIKILIVFIFLFNVVDALVTAHLFGAGLIEEVNPLMNVLLNRSMALFFSVKLFISSLCCVIFWYFREDKIVKVSVCAIFLLYFSIALYSLYFMAITSVSY